MAKRNAKLLEMKEDDRSNLPFPGVALWVVSRLGAASLGEMKTRIY